jgi:hypothetical protein
MLDFTVRFGVQGQNKTGPETLRTFLELANLSASRVAVKC